MTDHPIRPFTSDAAVRHVAGGLLAATLPKQEWTHEAHLAACLCLLREHPDVVLERDLPGVIRTYNEAVGGQNTDSAGYHETLTQLYIRGVRAFAATMPAGHPAGRCGQRPPRQRDRPARLAALLLFQGPPVQRRSPPRLGGTGSRHGGVIFAKDRTFPRVCPRSATGGPT
ncbi:hypothetical protein [Novosphingobium olei]|uniref:hypothetical protein n=1 Tax=Novosphingobium olei TaxID=2728851 RepID=UPI0030B8C07A